jgi:hypothetical protein
MPPGRRCRFGHLLQRAGAITVLEGMLVSLKRTCRLLPKAPKARHSLAQPIGLGLRNNYRPRAEGPRYFPDAPIPLPPDACHLQDQKPRSPDRPWPSIRTTRLFSRGPRSHRLHPLARGRNRKSRPPVALARTRTIAEVVEKTKTSSSKWIKTKGPASANFHWQAGYGAFSVSQSDAERVVAYVANQPKHHKKTSFQDEYRRFLERYAIAYDERYVWD